MLAPILPFGPDVGVSLDLQHLLLRASREIRVLAALTPVDALGERARLVAAVRARRSALPAWSYRPAVHEDLAQALRAAESALATSARAPVVLLHRDRARELCVEAALCAAAGTPDIARLAHERFGGAGADESRAATALCMQWLAEPPAEPEAGERIVSDASDPRSLLSRMRQGVGALGLPFAVIARPGLAPLAATGDRVILVTTGRALRPADIARTVLHEIEGHARPRSRAATARLALFATGTARGTDHQEGRALLLEERGQWLDRGRRRQLATRHLCVGAMRAGGTFHDVTRTLVDEYGVDAEEAVIVAERAFRGGNGLRPGLGRERIYLESFVRVRAHLERHPEDEAVMASGQVAVEAVEALRPFVPPFDEPPLHEPPRRGTR